MEHLGLPSGARLMEEDEIPYVSSMDYSRVSFLDQVKNNEMFRANADQLDMEYISACASKMTITDLESFFQSWLFFGLLQEMLGDHFNHDEFVRSTPSRAVISTESLPTRLRQWIIDPEVGQTRIAHVRHCLIVAHRALMATPDAFNMKVKLGIAATAEVIATSLIIVAKFRSIDIGPLQALGCWGDFDDPRLRVAEMQRRHGWCPGQASLTLGKFYALQSKVYLSKLNKTYAGQNHDQCTFEACHTWTIDISKYNSEHRHAGTCEYVASNQEEVIKVLKNGHNALLDLLLDKESNKVFLKIVPGHKHGAYVAISHVWADGLGNPKENSLPQCQLTRLYDLLTQFCTTKSLSQDQKRPYLWIDTLCCPVDTAGKMLALAKMPEVYRQASHVLALDSSLVEISCKDFEPIEVMSRVFSSGWMFRLWTLNEANLASNLWIQFQDGVLELSQISRNMAVMTEPETYHFTGELKSEYGKLRIESSEQPRSQLWFLTEALRYRSVCKVSDEPVCLAALLKIKADVIVGEERLQSSSSHEDRWKVRDIRMARLWKASIEGQPKIPKRIIYHIGNRLTTTGLRWAPSTLLGISDSSPFFCESEADLARPSKAGLILSSAAFGIKAVHRVDGMLSRPSTAASSMLDLVKYDESHWFSVFSTSGQKKHPPANEDMGLYDIIMDAGLGSEFDILTERSVNFSKESGTRMQCLLVSKTKGTTNPGQDKTRNVAFVRQGWIRCVDEITNDFLNSLLAHAQALQNDTVSQNLLENGKYGAQDPRYLEAIKRLVDKVGVVVNQIEDDLDRSGKHLPDSGLGLVQHRSKAIFAMLSRFYRNRYLVKEKDFPDTQEFCID